MRSTDNAKQAQPPRTKLSWIFRAGLFAYLFSTAITAEALTPTQPDTLTITLINHSNRTLSYKQANNSGVGNNFTLTNNEILPGASIVIQARSGLKSGVFGDLTFQDTTGYKSILKIRDPLQASSQKPLGMFALNNLRLISFVPSRTLNQETNSYNLTWTQATIEIQNRLKTA